MSLSERKRMARLVTLVAAIGLIELAVSQLIQRQPVIVAEPLTLEQVAYYEQGPILAELARAESE